MEKLPIEADLLTCVRLCAEQGRNSFTVKDFATAVGRTRTAALTRLQRLIVHNAVFCHNVGGRQSTKLYQIDWSELEMFHPGLYEIAQAEVKALGKSEIPTFSEGDSS